MATPGDAVHTTETMTPTERISEASATVAVAASDRPRRVLFLIDSLMSIGGAEAALRKMILHLPRFGFQCSIGAFELNTDPAFTRLFPCPLYHLPISNVYGPAALMAAWRLRQLVARHKYDVIHTIFPVSDLWGGPIARFGSPAALISGRRDMGIVRSAKHDWAYRYFGSLFDQVQAVSEAARQACLTRDGLSPERVVTVPNGVDLDQINQLEPQPDLRRRFALERPGPVVVTVAGTLAPVKGIDVLIQAAAIVCRQRPDTNFLVLGGTDNAYVRRTPALAEYNRELRRLTEALGVQSQLKFGGWTPDVIPAVKASDIFCLPSRSEGMSNALLEAMACGIPCVATDTGGTAEALVPYHTGYLVPPEAPEAMAAHLLPLLLDPELRSRMGRAGRERIRRSFTVEAMAALMAQHYDAVLGQRDTQRVAAWRSPNVRHEQRRS